MSRHRMFIAAIVAGGALVALPGQAPAASCKKAKEQKGCTLPNGTSYQYTNSETDEMNLRVERGKATLDMRSACIPDRTQRYKLKSLPKVGRSYKFDKTEQVTSELQDGITVTYTYTLKLTIKITSALKATTTGSATVTAPEVPAQGSFAGEDAFNSNCKLTGKTLKRVVGD